MKKLLIAMLFTVTLMAQHIQPGQITGLTPGQGVVSNAAGSLANTQIFYADQFAGADATHKLDAAITAAGSNPATVIASPGMGAGLPTTIPNNILFIDQRQVTDPLSNNPTIADRLSPFYLNANLDELSYRALTGTITMTNGSTAVTGSGTSFLSQLLVPGADSIRLVADGVTSWAKIATVTDNTHLTLAATYTGTGGSGSAIAMQTQLPMFIRMTLSGGTPNTSLMGEGVGLTITCYRSGGSRAIFCQNNNLVFNNRLRAAFVNEYDVINSSGGDWTEGGITINGETNRSGGVSILGAGANRAEVGLVISDLGSGSEFLRGIENRGWYSKGIFSTTRNTAGPHFYGIPAADNSNAAIVLRNAADAANVARINNDGSAQFNGNLTIGDGTGTPSLYTNGAVANNRFHFWQTNASNRWGLGADNSTESGANAGSDFKITSYADNGTFLATPFTIQRTTGNILFSGKFTSYNGTSLVSNGVAAIIGSLDTSSNLTTSGTLFTAPSTGLYELSYYAFTTTTDVVGSMKLTLTWDDSTGPWFIDSGNLPLNANAYINGSFPVYIPQGGTVLYTNTVSGGSTSGVYHVIIKAKRL